jgi:hypothetical protein
LFRIQFPDNKGIKELSSIDNDQLDNSIVDKNNDAYQTGLDIANIISYFWNSQKNPGKVYISNRRIHHGEIGSLLGLSKIGRATCRERVYSIV